MSTSNPGSPKTSALLVEFLMQIVDRSWPILGRLMRVHSRVYRATVGFLGKRLPFTPPMLLLDHIGAKTGKRRTTTLVYMPDGDRVIVLAAKGGHPTNPAWLYNVRAHPDTRVQIGRKKYDVHAREAVDQERSNLWPRALAYTGHWRRYEQRTDRTIPLIVLEPRRA